MRLVPSCDAIRAMLPAQVREKVWVQALADPYGLRMQVWFFLVPDRDGVPGTLLLRTVMTEEAPGRWSLPPEAVSHLCLAVP